MQNVKTDYLSEELELLDDDDEPQSSGHGLPRDTVYVKVWGRMYKVHAELTTDSPQTYLELADLEYFIAARESFRPRNASEAWLHEYLTEAAESGVERSEAMAEGSVLGFTRKTLERAFTGIGAHSHRQGVRLPARWYRNESLCPKVH